VKRGLKEAAEQMREPMNKAFREGGRKNAFKLPRWYRLRMFVFSHAFVPRISGALIITAIANGFILSFPFFERAAAN
jgi:hypothetical protein